MGCCIEFEAKRKVSRGEFFKLYPDGAYTALQTVDSRLRIVQLDRHLSRLKQSSFELFQREIDESMILRLLGKCIDEGIGTDLKIIVLVYNKDGLIPVAFVEEYTPTDLSPCNVFCYGNPRRNPLCKYSRWIAERAYIEAKRPPNTTEMILHKGGNIYEGCVSNFYAVTKDPDGIECVIRAPSGILVGTIGIAVEELFKANQIRFREEFPKTDGISWTGCFLTSKIS